MKSNWWVKMFVAIFAIGEITGRLTLIISGHPFKVDHVSGAERTHCSCHRSEIWRELTVFGLGKLWQNPQGLRKLLSCVRSWTLFVNLLSRQQPTSFFCEWTHIFWTGYIHHGSCPPSSYSTNSHQSVNYLCNTWIFITIVAPAKKQLMYWNERPFSLLDIISHHNWVGICENLQAGELAVLSIDCCGAINFFPYLWILGGN